MSKTFTPIPIVLILCAILAAAYFANCQISQHAKTAHVGQLTEAEKAYHSLVSVANQNKTCEVLKVRICLFATNHDKTSSHFGELSPQARVYCGSPAFGFMGVFGLANGTIFITGYAVSNARFDFYCDRDLCTPGDFMYLQGLVR